MKVFKILVKNGGNDLIKVKILSEDENLAILKAKKIFSIVYFDIFKYLTFKIYD